MAEIGVSASNAYRRSAKSALTGSALMPIGNPDCLAVLVVHESRNLKNLYGDIRWPQGIDQCLQC